MSAIRIKDIGGVVADADLTFTQAGKAVCKVRLGFSDAVYDQETQQWKNVNQFYVEGTAWEKTALQLAEVATQGTQLLVWGALATDQWEDKQTGDKRSKPALKIKGFRPVGKLPDVGQQAQQTQPQGHAGGQPQSDPWGAQQPAQPQSQGWDTPADSAGPPPF